MANFKIKTQHAAVIVWNYDDRIVAEGAQKQNLNRINETVISTVSCISIQTNKSKGSPVGTFQLVLSPYKNWVSALTTGSWCVILMSNKPITAGSLKNADPDMVKMFGKIETVRVDTQQVNDTRQTRYLVSGVDWGHIFNNVLYIDNLLAAANDPLTQGNAAAVAIRNALFGKGNSPQSFAVKDNLNSLINIFGNNLGALTKAGNDINRLAKSTYDFTMPKEVVDFFRFVGPNGNPNSAEILNKALTLQTGRLIGPNLYDEKPEAYGFINPASLQGTNSFWQILLDNSNPALNEMFCDLNWTNNGPQLMLYNRIKPFSYKKNDVSSSANNIRSLFYNIKTHEIDALDVISVNAGTNWRDKYNFIEIKPAMSDFNIIDNWVKQKTQTKDEEAFNREGFRPLIVASKQFPVNPGTDSNAFDPNSLITWTQLMREWYFDTHRLLNGTLTIVGQNEYIGIGNNIRFDAGLINPTPNLNKASNQAKTNYSILAHVENVQHNFSINEDGTRTYLTTIQFVRGIVVDKNNTVVGEGALDQFADSMQSDETRNTANTVTTSSGDDPDKKVKGT